MTSDPEPRSPYPIDPDMDLHYLVFLKDAWRSEDVDSLLAKVLEEMKDVPPEKRREVLVWRGEFWNSMYERVSSSRYNLWSIGLPQASSMNMHKLLTQIAGDFPMVNEAGTAPPDQVGCKPYLLVTPEQIYQFDWRKKPGTKGKLELGGTKFPVRYLNYFYY